jgi:hypothetical protein
MLRAKFRRFLLQKAVAIACPVATGLRNEALTVRFWTFGVVTLEIALVQV